MGKKGIIFLIIGIILVALIGASVYANFYIKKIVAEKLSDEYDLKFTSLETSLWNQSIRVDSLDGFLNKGSLARAQLEDLNWLALYRDPKVDLDKISFTMSNFTTMSKDGMHELTIDSLSKQGDAIYLYSLSISSPYSDETFHQKVKFRTPKIGLEIPQLTLTGFSANDNKVAKADIPSFVLDVDENLNIPVEGNKKKLPTELIGEMDFPFHLKKLLMKSGTIKYAVIDQGSSNKGALEFNNVTLNGSGIASDSTVEEMILELKCQVGAAPLKVVTRNFLNHPEYKYDFYGHLQDFDFVELNSLTEAAKDITITSGDLKSLTLEGSFYDSRAEGTMDIDYDNLKIDVNKNLAGIADFLANAAISKSGEEKVEFDTTRDKEKGFLVHVVQSLVKSLKDALLII